MSSTLYFADLIRETSLSSGTGDFALGGATPGHRAFAGNVPENAEFYYAIAGISHEEEWETGKGHVSSSGHLVRTPIASSHDNGVVDFSEGLKLVTLTATAHWHQHIYEALHNNGDALADLANQLDSKQPLGQYAAASHSHDMGNITGLHTALAGKQSAGNYAKTSMGDEIIGGFGAAQTSVIDDFNAVVNSRSGQGQTLLSGSATNGLGLAGYYHSFTFEFRNRNGTGNRTQFAIPYHYGSPHMAYRTFFDSDWTNWHGILAETTNSQYVPLKDNQSSLGAGHLRFTQLFAASSTVNTSDARLKKWHGATTETEYRIGMRIFDELEFFQWHEAIQKKGQDKARYHFGVRAQRVFAIIDEEMDKDGAWRRFAFCCYDEWPEEKSYPLDADGHEDREAEAIITRSSGDLYGIRIDQLNCFLLACLKYHQNILETRIAALENTQEQAA